MGELGTRVGVLRVGESWAGVLRLEVSGGRFADDAGTEDAVAENSGAEDAVAEDSGAVISVLGTGDAFCGACHLSCIVGLRPGH